VEDDPIAPCWMNCALCQFSDAACCLSIGILIIYEPEGHDTNFPGINQYGFGHIAFHADDIEEVLASVLAHGGTKFGGLVKKEHEGLGTFAGVYARDPEGNVIEIQNWKR